MITVLYILSLLASGLMLVLIIKQFDYKVSSIYALIYLMITVCDFGYLQLLHAKTLEGALLANTITYIGGCFIPFLMLLCVCRICHFRQKKERGFLHNGFRACSDLFCGYFGLFCGESVKDARKAYALCLSDHGDGTVLAGKQNQKK